VRFTNKISKQHVVRMLVASCIVSLLGFSIYMLAGRFDLINFRRLDETVTDRTATIKDTGKTAEAPSPVKRMGVFTAYTSRPQETDNKPYISADETNLKVHPTCVVGNNKLKLGTKIKIQGIGLCEVRDRIGRSRGANHFDLYMGNDVAGAKYFGKRKLLYSIVEGPQKGG
jgi:3D (Asp-Asp-Asp) domain-containing protein